LRAEIVKPHRARNKVIDHERVWGIQEKPIEVAAVYEVTRRVESATWWFFARTR